MLHISLLYLRQPYLRQLFLPVEAGNNDLASILDLVFIVVMVIDTVVVVVLGIDMVDIVVEVVDDIIVAVLAEVVLALICCLLKS